jgi:hypothetical protein
VLLKVVNGDLEPKRVEAGVLTVDLSAVRTHFTVHVSDYTVTPLPAIVPLFFIWSSDLAGELELSAIRSVPNLLVLKSEAKAMTVMMVSKQKNFTVDVTATQTF